MICLGQLVLDFTIHTSGQLVLDFTIHTSGQETAQGRDSVDPKLLRGDCQIPASGLDLAIHAERNWIY
jgi:hypothetical protein